jgi:hypothetical protein
MVLLRAYEAVRWLVTLYCGQLFQLLAQPLLVMAPPPRLRCPDCGGLLMLVAVYPASWTVSGLWSYFDTS